MISKPLDAITPDDLHRLVENRISEGKTIEYKQVLPGGSDGERIKFLRAVSSLTNRAGGDLLHGVKAQDGVPEALPGLQRPNEDETKLRLENLLRDGVEPRIPTVQFRFVPVNGDRAILIIRVGKSWNGPHRVKLAGHAHFYGRNSSGAYPLDVGELRTAFTLSAGIAERIRAFRADRLMKIEAGQTPVPIVTAATMVFHLVPLFASCRLLLIASYQNFVRPQRAKCLQSFGMFGLVDKLKSRRLRLIHRPETRQQRLHAGVPLRNGRIGSGI
ncbi:MAG: AlbA family DNA-binding domain-containing protein [Gammaproteobacteria bacterium]